MDVQLCGWNGGRQAIAQSCGDRFKGVSAPERSEPNAYDTLTHRRGRKSVGVDAGEPSLARDRGIRQHRTLERQGGAVACGERRSHRHPIGNFELSLVESREKIGRERRQQSSGDEEHADGACIDERSPGERPTQNRSVPSQAARHRCVLSVRRAATEQGAKKQRSHEHREAERDHQRAGERQRKSSEEGARHAAE